MGLREQYHYNSYDNCRNTMTEMIGVIASENSAEDKVRVLLNMIIDCRINTMVEHYKTITKMADIESKKAKRLANNTKKKR